jgi:hypothetical protein
MTTRKGRALTAAEVPTGLGIVLGRAVRAFCVFVVVGLATSLTIRDLYARRGTERTSQESGTRSETHQSATAGRITHVLGSDAGVVLNFIKPDKTADFEAVIAKVREALQASDKPERKRQAASWKVFRAVEPGANGSVLYMFVIDPAVKGADYTVSGILAEGFPNEVQALYQQYAGAYAGGQNFVNLTLISALGQ